MKIKHMPEEHIDACHDCNYHEGVVYDYGYDESGKKVYYCMHPRAPETNKIDGYVEGTFFPSTCPLEDA